MQMKVKKILCDQVLSEKKKSWFIDNEISQDKDASINPIIALHMYAQVLGSLCEYGILLKLLKLFFFFLILNPENNL